MTPVLKPKLIRGHCYKPVLSEKERRAYQAAHQIMTTDTLDRELVCPGERRSRQIDRIAKIIVDSFK